MSHSNKSINQTDIRLLETDNPASFTDLIWLFAEVFEMDNFKLPPAAYQKKLLEREDFLVFAAFHQQKVIGGLTTYVLHQYYEEKPLAYIYDVAVATDWQRQGIGRMLINAHNDYCRKQGFAEAYVQADLEDDHAIEFYRKTQAAEAPVVQFSYYF